MAVQSSTPALDSEEWVTMLDNAIAENENVNEQNREGARGARNIVLK